MGDMAVSIQSKSAWHAVGERIGTVSLWVNKTYSEAGEVKLKSADWSDEPVELISCRTAGIWTA